MERFYGFDLGDAESAVSKLTDRETRVPEVIPVSGEKSFITAYAQKADGSMIIGEEACYVPDAGTRSLRFKSRFLTDPASAEDVRCFAGGVLSELKKSEAVNEEEDCCVYVGCPAGWDKDARERYREIFERTGYPPTRIISESRAALVNACQSRHLQVGYDILSRPVLVVDIGSSTTDFAYISSGHEVELKTAGEVRLGGGIMDELLLEMAVSESSCKDELLKIFSQSPPWKSYCEFAGRRLKEQYFGDEAYWQERECSKTVSVRYRHQLKLKFSLNKVKAARLLEGPADCLGGRSFRHVFTESLKEVRRQIDGPKPELLFLTGGVSRLQAVREWCRDVFPEAVVVTSTEPEFSVSRGLAQSGRIDEQVREFKQDVTALIDSPVVEDIVADQISHLYELTAEALVDPILENAALPVFDRWRSGSIRRLSDVNDALQKEITAWLNTEEARKLLVAPVKEWLKGIAAALEEYTAPICIRHGVPNAALNLSTYLTAEDIELQVDAKDVFAVEQITWMIDGVITVIVSLFCGGSGVALIYSGLPGIIAGAVITLLVLMIGKNPMEKAFLKLDIPKPARKLIPRNHFRTRLSSISDDVRASLKETLAKEKTNEITDRMVAEISEQIEECLTKMAEVVEIPLG